ncbi:MAG TPA: hypothetical protein VM901_08715 [Bdellovibrionota bacterium]|jgi:hypothetical protein|nr:hypothetical protein [Bdellovibrionota bacterium]
MRKLSFAFLTLISVVASAEPAVEHASQMVKTKVRGDHVEVTDLNTGKVSKGSPLGLAPGAYPEDSGATRNVPYEQKNPLVWSGYQALKKQGYDGLSRNDKDFAEMVNAFAEKMSSVQVRQEGAAEQMEAEVKRYQKLLSAGRGKSESLRNWTLYQAALTRKIRSLETALREKNEPQPKEFLRELARRIAATRLVDGQRATAAYWEDRLYNFYFSQK